MSPYFAWRAPPISLHATFCIYINVYIYTIIDCKRKNDNSYFTQESLFRSTPTAFEAIELHRRTGHGTLALCPVSFHGTDDRTHIRIT